MTAPTTPFEYRGAALAAAAEYLVGPDAELL